VADLFGRPVWVNDPDGFLHYTEYDPMTGAVVKIIADVNTATTSDFTGLPSGLEHPGDGGLHLKATSEFDLLGRPHRLRRVSGLAERGTVLQGLGCEHQHADGADYRCAERHGGGLHRSLDHERNPLLV
jgi:hypothetical protein